MSLFDRLQSVVDKTGGVIGGVVDGTVQVTTSAFSAVVDTFASVSGFGTKDNANSDRKKGRKKFASQLPSEDMQQTFTAQLPSKEMQQSSFTAEEDPEVRRQREDAFRKAAAEADKMKWQGRNWDDRRRETWSGQAERNVAGGGPVTYQQAILAQPMPVLSPLRGTNTPQGVRAIVDASVGTTTASFNPALGTPGVAIPSNATAGSLDASIKVNVTNSAAPVGVNVSSSFAAMFD